MKRTLLIVSLAVWCAAAWSAGPVALVGGGYGKYVRNSFIKKILLPMDVAYEDFGESMDFSRLDEFSLVIVAHGDEKLRESGDPAPAFEQYVRGGGHVLLIANAPTMLLDTRDFSAHPWIGAQGWVYHRDNPVASLLRPDHEWLQGLDATREYFWLSASQLLTGPTTAEALIGSDDSVYLSVNEYGEGWTAFLARGPFPFKREDVGPEREAQAGMLRRMVAAAGPLTVPEQISAAMADAGRPLIVWQRDWQFGSKEGPQFRPPYPGAGEQVTSLAADLALAEREDLQLNLLPLAQGGEISVAVTPLGLAGGATGPAPEVEVRVMARAPLIPWDKPGIEPAESPFWLMASETLAPEGSPAFEAPALRNTVVWLQLRAPEDCSPGIWRGEVRISGAGETIIPLEVTVWPILAPQDRLFQLKYWGGSTPDVRQWDELQREGACSATLSYPDLAQVMVTELGVSLEEALAGSPEIFARDPFPRLDFSYLDQFVGQQAARGLRVVRLQDVKTGGIVANAATGLSLEWQEAWGEQATDEWRRVWVAYYRELMAYLRSKGFRRVEPIWTDEPSVESIEQNYLPLAKLYQQAGMFPGSNWTTPGFMTAEDVNRFAHGVGDWSMYSIMMPEFFRYLREGSVKLVEGARIGQTRGGYGWAHRNPADNVRRLCWDAWHNGATYIRSGPIWKSWIYYMNYEVAIRDEGVSGERLLAYSTSDPADLSAPMLASPDWIAAREGADDLSLMMALQWYVERLREVPDLPAGLLDGIEAEIAAFVGDESPWDLRLEPRHYEVTRLGLAYDYTATVDATSADMRRAKRRVLELLASLTPYAKQLPVELTWHEVTLAAGGVHCQTANRAHAYALAEWLRLRTGLEFASVLGLYVGKPGVFLATVGDEGLRALAEDHGWDLESWLPRARSYSIFTDAEGQAVAVVGADETGLAQGVEAFKGFASPRGHWIRKN